jgi:hypothetical protein
LHPFGNVVTMPVMGSRDAQPVAGLSQRCADDTSLWRDKADALADCLGLELMRRKAKHEQNL